MQQDNSIFSNAPKNIELTKLRSNGMLPSWVTGKLVRNGPALFNLESTSLRHWFDGYGMLHSFLFENGEVFYQSRYIESEEYLRASESGKVKTVAWVPLRIRVVLYSEGSLANFFCAAFQY